MATIAEARLVRFYGDDKGWHVREKGGPSGGLRLSTSSLPQSQSSILDPGRVPNDLLSYVRGFKDTAWMIHDFGPLSRSTAADGTPIVMINVIYVKEVPRRL
ncbi:MAG: hypothetical protein Q9208_007816 [Pyrenodesmia sp. 3 TL-2023]